MLLAVMCTLPVRWCRGYLFALEKRDAGLLSIETITLQLTIAVIAKMAAIRKRLLLSAPIYNDALFMLVTALEGKFALPFYAFGHSFWENSRIIRGLPSRKGVNETSMKYQKVHKPSDERDKLRKFRELDDAFAQALRQLEDPNSAMDIPTGPPVRSLEALEEEEAEKEAEKSAERRDEQFQQQFEALLTEYHIAPHDLRQLIETLLTTGHWAEEQVPA